MSLATRDVATSMIVRLLPVDLLIAIMATISWLVFVDVQDVGGTAVLCAVVFVGHVLIWVLLLRASLAPARPWMLRTRACSDAELLAAERAIDRTPAAIAVGYAAAWAVYFVGVALAAWLWFPELIALGRVELSAMGFQFAAIAIGPAPMVFPLADLMLADTQTELAAELDLRGIMQARPPSSMGRRLTSLAVTLVIAPTAWLSGMSWLAHGNAARDQTMATAIAEARWSAHRVDDGELPTIQFAIVEESELAPGLRERIGESEVIAALDRRSELVSAAAPLADGRWLLLELPVDVDDRNHWVGLVAVALALLFWALFSIVATSRSILQPLSRLHSALHRVTTVGDLRAFRRIPVLRRDEIGAVASQFNAMLDVFENLADAAQTVANGDLRVRIDGSGDLQDAFRHMVERLASLVEEIRDAAVAVASTSAEIHATAMNQEQAASQQTREVEAVEVGMRRLAESAGSIADTAGKVLHDAQQTRSRSEQVAAELSSLGVHVERIAELLALIRDIAGRSDLLALNGSLEATRAGEAGRGFALVAAEMRRLAERVSSTAHDVSSTLEDVNQANHATANATSDSRNLAEGTTLAAQQIVALTRTQDGESRQMSTAMLEIVEIVSASAAASTQIRAAAANLRSEAERLEQLIEQFEIPEQ